MKDIEEIYPLTPMQEAMLLHAVGNPASTELHTQIVFRLGSAIDLDSMDRAWARLIKQHASLRTGFHWQSEKGPLQFVRRKIEFKGQVKQLAVSTSSAMDAQIKKVLQADKAETFDLARAPLMRATYLECGNGESLMLWTSHHLILDRWCIPLVISELESYLATSSSERLQMSREAISPYQFKSYLGYISAQSAALNYWLDYLQGYRVSPSLVSRLGDPAAEELLVRQSSHHIPLHDLADFNRQKEQLETTAAVMCQLAWALTISKLTDSVDVLLGVTVSGRPPTLQGVDRIIGCFINNVLTRTVIESSSSLSELVHAMQQQQQEREPYQHVSLLQLNNAMELEGNAALVDTLFLWLNNIRAGTYNGTSTLKTADRMVPLDQYAQDTASVFPLTMTVYESQRGLEFRLKLAPGYTSVVPLDQILIVYRDVLSLVCSSDPQFGLSKMLGLQCEARATSSINSRDIPNFAALTGLQLIDDRNSGRAGLEPAFVEQVLTQEWKSALQLDQLDSGSSFFDMGGSSLNAARLHSRVESMLRCAIPIISMFRKPYLADMVDLIVENDWSMKAEVCLPVRGSGSASPLFCIATPDVNTIGFAQLANHMSHDRPVYVLQAPPDSSEFREVSPSEIPALAKTYVDAMKAARPQGPYHLLGMCTGSQLAFEMAKILESNDDSCGFIGILNTWANYTMSRAYRLQQASVRFGLLQEERILDWPAVIWHRLITRRVLRPLKKRLFSAVGEGDQVPIGLTAGQVAPSIGERTKSHSDNEADHELSTAQGMQRWSADDTKSGPDNAGSKHIAGSNNSVDEWVHLCGWRHLYKPVPKLQQKLTILRIKEQPFWRIRSENLGWELHGENIELKRLDCDDHHNLFREPWISELGASLDSSLQEYK